MHTYRPRRRRTWRRRLKRMIGWTIFQVMLWVAVFSLLGALAR